MSFETLKSGDIVNFDMIRPGIFGDQYKAAIIASVGDFNVAQAIDPDVVAKHENFFPFFKDKVDNVNNPKLYKYLILQLDKTNPKLTVIGKHWINADSLITIQSRNATVIIQNFQEFHRAPLTDFLEGLNVSYQLIVNDEL